MFIWSCAIYRFYKTHTHTYTHIHTCPYVLYTRLKQASRNLHKNVSQITISAYTLKIKFLQPPMQQNRILLPLKHSKTKSKTKNLRESWTSVSSN